MKKDRFIRPRRQRSVVVTVRFEDDAILRIAEKAVKEKRTVSNLIEWIVTNWIEETDGNNG